MRFALAKFAVDLRARANLKCKKRLGKRPNRREASARGGEQMALAERTRIRNHPERAVPDETEEILASGMVAHVGFVDGGEPYVIPLSYHFDPDTPASLYLHGSIRSRAMKRLASGAPVCVTVTLTDGLVYSRKAMNHSMNYRSAMVFGSGREVADEREKSRIFDAMVRRYFPGRTLGVDYNIPPSADLGVTDLVEVRIEDRSGKARRGGPTGPDDNKPDALGSAGVVELREF